MGIALSNFREQAREEFPGLALDLDDGSTLNFRSITDLDDEQLERFVAVQKILEDAGEENDLRGTKNSFVNILSEVADDADRARVLLARESLGTLMVIFRAYGETVTDTATKSGQPS